MDETPDNVIKLRPKYDYAFDCFVCECGSCHFFIAVDMRAVCVNCRHWIKGEIIFDGLT